MFTNQIIKYLHKSLTTYGCSDIVPSCGNVLQIEINGWSVRLRAVGWVVKQGDELLTSQERGDYLGVDTLVKVCQLIGKTLEGLYLNDTKELVLVFEGGYVLHADLSQSGIEVCTSNKQVITLGPYGSEGEVLWSCEFISALVT